VVAGGTGFQRWFAAAKAKGVYKGRPAKIKSGEIAVLKGEGLGATEIAKRLKIGRASVYRALPDWTKEMGK
jgi:DNA invertase Pin-like site-specific DNA recombinase